MLQVFRLLWPFFTHFPAFITFHFLDVLDLKAVQNNCLNALKASMFPDDSGRFIKLGSLDILGVSVWRSDSSWIKSGLVAGGHFRSLEWEWCESLRRLRKWSLINKGRNGPAGGALQRDPFSILPVSGWKGAYSGGFSVYAIERLGGQQMCLWVGVGGGSYICILEHLCVCWSLWPPLLFLTCVWEVGWWRPAGTPGDPSSTPPTHTLPTTAWLPGPGFLRGSPRRLCVRQRLTSPCIFNANLLSVLTNRTSQGGWGGGQFRDWEGWSWRQREIIKSNKTSGCSRQPGRVTKTQPPV